MDSQESLTVLAVVFALTAVSLWLERTRLGKTVSGAVIVLIFAVIASNIGVLPRSSPVYTAIWDLGIPLAIALYLSQANLMTLFTQGGRVLLAFSFGALGVMAAAIIGAFFLDLGTYTAELAAVFSATYSGGSMNFAAVADATGFTDATTLAAAITVDNLFGILFFVLLAASANWSWFKNTFDDRIDSSPSAAIEKDVVVESISAQDISVVLAVSALVCSVGFYVAQLFGVPEYSILFISVFMLALATVTGGKIDRKRVAEQIATLIMFAFFITLGAGADIQKLFSVAPALLVLVGFIFFAHVVMTLIGAYLFKINYREIIIASAACIGGPPIAVAYAALFGWDRLASAAIGVGVLGYALGNFIGLGVFEIVLAFSPSV